MEHSKDSIVKIIAESRYAPMRTLDGEGLIGCVWHDNDTYSTMMYGGWSWNMVVQCLVELLHALKTSFDKTDTELLMLLMLGLEDKTKKAEMEED